MKLYFGLFFDGTVNNMFNVGQQPPFFNKKSLTLNELTSDSEKDRLAIEKYIEQNSRPADDSAREFAREYSKKSLLNDPLEDLINSMFDRTGSYKNDITNVALLYKSYTKNQQVIYDNQHFAIYLDGIGTERGELDAPLTSSLGWTYVGKNKIRGVIGRTDKAIEQIRYFLKTWLQTNPDTIVDDIIFDVYGFSRGCAAARHFCNRVYKKDAVLVETISDVLGKNWKNTSGDPAGSVRFLGIFDTVAAIFALSEGDFAGNVHDGQTGDIDLTLAANSVGKLTHLTAQDECRYNYSSNEVLPNYSSLAIPGVHSDVGGGYAKTIIEESLIS